MSAANEILALSYPLMPVLEIPELALAQPLADALRAGGITTLEVTLRTGAGLAAIAQLTRDNPDLLIGAGTVTSAQQLRAAEDAGAAFAISPGLSDSLLDAAAGTQLPLIPGVMTAGEIMTALDAGLNCLKLFPAEVAGGVAFLNAIGGPFPDVKFCPTGGVTAASLGAYLALPNVLCAGGSWVAPRALIAAGEWAKITALCLAVTGGYR